MKDTLTVRAVIDNSYIITDFVEANLEKIGCPLKIKMQVNIAIDEIFSNISYYAYASDDSKKLIDASLQTVTVCFEFDSSNNEIRLSFLDNGKQYNPLEKTDPDVTLSAEEREVGGLGIFIVKKSMDDVIYEYINNQNVLTIVKKIS